MKKKIMLVEDSKAIRMTTRMTLTLHGGYEVLDFADAETAYNELHNQVDVDLIISDLNLPGMSGFDLIKKTKNDEIKYKNTPVLIVTGESKALELQKLSCGGIIDGWLSKPFDENVLMTLVKTYLEN